jgi:hypothetical protein
MVRTRRRIIFTGIGLLGLIAGPPQTQAGPINISLVAGLAGAPTPTGSGEIRFDNPRGAVVAIARLSVGDTVRAVTGGGVVFFGGAGTPVVLDLSDGRAHLSSSNAPADAAGAVGSAGGGAATAVPQAGGEIPSYAALLGLSLSDPGLDGGRVLSAGVTDGAGGVLGRTQVTVPGGGWWVLGLGPGDVTAPPPVIVDPPHDPEPDPPTGGGGSPGLPPGVTTTPEPSAIILASLGVGIVAARRTRRPHSPGAPRTVFESPCE